MERTWNDKRQPKKIKFDSKELLYERYILPFFYFPSLPRRKERVIESCFSSPFTLVFPSVFPSQIDGDRVEKLKEMIDSLAWIIEADEEDLIVDLKREIVSKVKDF